MKNGTYIKTINNIKLYWSDEQEMYYTRVRGKGILEEFRTEGRAEQWMNETTDFLSKNQKTTRQSV